MVDDAQSPDTTLGAILEEEEYSYNEISTIQMAVHKWRRKKLLQKSFSAVWTRKEFFFKNQLLLLPLHGTTHFNYH
jgi:hypothetical protein